MKKFLYKNPVVSSLILNSGSCVVALKSINNDQYLFLSPIIVTYILNKKIITYGENLNKLKKIALCLIYFLMISLSFVFNKYTFA